MGISLRSSAASTSSTSHKSLSQSMKSAHTSWQSGPRVELILPSSSGQFQCAIGHDYRLLSEACPLLLAQASESASLAGQAVENPQSHYACLGCSKLKWAVRSGCMVSASEACALRLFAVRSQSYHRCHSYIQEVSVITWIRSVSIPTKTF